MYDSFTTLAIEQADGVLTCRFNRPDRRNAVDDVMHRELVRFFEEFLPGQRGLSPNTVRSYRDAMLLLP